jgi:spermidine/putrescine transport system permease protein
MFARLTDPWRKPRILFAFTMVYLAWTLVPLAVAIAFSFNNGLSRSSWQGFSLQWYYGNPGESLFQSTYLVGALVQTIKLGALTMLIAVPVGACFAIGMARWRGRTPLGRAIRGTSNLLVLLAFVLPEIVLAIAFFSSITRLLSFLGLGTASQVLGLVTVNLAVPVLIVRARLLTLGPEYEEMAMDLGASPGQAIRRVLVPLLYPAVVASSLIVMSRAFEDLVLVRYLSDPGNPFTEPMSVKIYGGFRGSPSPVYNAMAAVVAVTMLLVATVGLLLYGRYARKDASAPKPW